MSAFLDDVDRFVAAAVGTTGSRDELQRLSGETYRHIGRAEQAELDDGLGRLAGALARAHPMAAGVVALTCGGFVENGGDPAVSFGPLLDRLPPMLADTARFFDRCLELHAADRTPAAGEDEDDEPDVYELADRFLRPVYEADPALAIGYNNYRPMYLSAVAHLSASKALRTTLPRKAELLELSDQVDRYGRGGRSFLTKMLLVLDDEPLVVLDPGQRRGYRLTIGGVADNFQLHVLLAGALIGDPAAGWLDYPPPEPAAVAVARGGAGGPNDYATASFFTWNWTALRPAGRTVGAGPVDPVGTAERVWNEGVPADIVPFDGGRLVLLGPALYSSSWNAGRVFSDLPPEVRVDARLTPDEVDRWLARVAAANADSGRP